MFTKEIYGNYSANFLVGHIRRCVNPVSLQARIGKYANCNDTRITFLNATFPQLPFDVNIDLEETRYHVERQPRISANFIFVYIRRCVKPGSLPARNGKYAFCTETRISILGCTFPQLPFDVNIALVQTRYHVERQPTISEYFIVATVQRFGIPVSLQARFGKNAYCTETRITFLGYTFQQLSCDVNIALVQRRYHVERQPRISANFIVSPIRRCVNPGSLQARIGMYAFCTKAIFTS